MLRRALILLFWLAPTPAPGAGTTPAVNVDMGCTVSGQTLGYNGSAIVCQTAQRPVTTVGALPTCNSATKGAMYFVTDALTPVALSTAAAGGAVQVGVTCNGTNWIVQ